MMFEKVRVNRFGDNIETQFAIVEQYSGLSDAWGGNATVGKNTVCHQLAHPCRVLSRVFQKQFGQTGKSLMRLFPVKFQSQAWVLVNRLKRATTFEPNTHVLQ